MTSADSPPRSHAPSKQDRQAGVDAKMVELHGAYGGFPLTLAHGHPDYALLQFAFNVWEQAGAVRLVTNGPSPRAAVANARAAFEASLDMYALVAEPSLYDEMGLYSSLRATSQGGPSKTEGYREPDLNPSSGHR